MSKLNVGLANFTVSLYKKEASGCSGNVFMSPHSVSAALLLTFAGARGNTEKEIKTALGLGEIASEEIHKGYHELHKRFNVQKEDANSVIAIANRAFSKIGLTVSAEYQATTKQFYGSELELMDFAGDTEGSRQKINKWVEDQTREKIKYLLPGGFIDDRLLIVLVNAIYFKGNWDKQFDERKTMKEEFHTSKDDTVEVDMMFKKDNFNFCKNDAMKFSALELHYKGKDMSMVIFLPDETTGINELEDKLTADLITSTIGELRHTNDVMVKFPKFKMECSFELSKTLPNMGLKDMFIPGTADLSGMIENPPQPPYVSEVIHKAFVEVNEEGTEAAAATGVVIQCFALVTPTEFFADHPFLFLIRDNITNTILFIGRCAKPQQ